ncbi:hypothetical protein [Promicromonospora iranensis]|uniref:hypothetical protein n=1 Tax=Promicromonospora iranensis TaxID=1105144 RepID=UPI0023A946D0|nr:hypothetical protein [Promicromonospora iranensis]
MSQRDQAERSSTGSGRPGLFAEVQDEISQLVSHELSRLRQRTSLTATDQAEVALALHRLTVRLTLTTLAARSRSPHALPDRPDILDQDRQGTA